MCLEKHFHNNRLNLTIVINSIKITINMAISFFCTETYPEINRNWNIIFCLKS